MDRLDTRQLSDAILNAPGWARVGLTMRDQRMRQKAADEVANCIVERLSDYPEIPDPNQLSLFP
ncbi:MULTISPECIES: DUF6771 family protein [unclassified Novosphingobium]|uniref:DUF6771 family protein n=1 Tax=unclassified Novosphingobium TaxID=2644732 RepID=UPI0009E93A0A|nr:DUF6771 family protein [Novosphingobium sp. ST904]